MKSKATALDPTLKIALGSLIVSLIVLAVKFAAYKVTGSVALYSDAVESIINIATAAAAIVAIRIAAQPADAEHPFGHHKAEYLTAVIVGALIVTAGAAILHQAWQGFMAPHAMDAPIAGIVISTLATLLNVGWSRKLISHGKKHRSAALVSDGKHLMSDVYTSLGVIMGVGLVAVSGIAILDSLIAALVALHVLYSGWEVIRDNTSGLLDEALPEQELALINTIINANPKVIETHDLRTRHAGKATFIEFHLIVPGTMTVASSHTICDNLESALKAALPGSHITIHVEPEHKAKHTKA